MIMKRISLLLTSAIILTLLSCGKKSSDTVDAQSEQDVAQASQESVVYKINSKESSIKWLGKKVTGQHDGTVDIASGQMNVDDNMVSAGTFIIDMTSITVLDIEDEKTNAKLTNHLKDDDFFGVDSFPDAKFEITSVESMDEVAENEPNFTVKGNLILKGISKNISFPAKIDFTDHSMHAHARFSLDRTDWNIKYGSGKFFDDLGDKMIYDDFELELDIKAEKLDQES